MIRDETVLRSKSTDWPLFAFITDSPEIGILESRAVIASLKTTGPDADVPLSWRQLSISFPSKTFSFWKRLCGRSGVGPQHQAS
ncbi:MAG: hypothetical protein JWQ64_1621 [Subtercola sp.]|nr:hypothetical protein [Subtercola sp.]